MFLIFSVYLVYQQTTIIRMRNQIADQFESLARVETLTNEVYKLAALDQLTGLYNRRSGELRLGEEISRAVRHGRPLTLLLLDVDGLKQINDYYGHLIGSHALCRVQDRRSEARFSARGWTATELRRPEHCLPLLARLDRLPPGQVRRTTDETR